MQLWPRGGREELQRLLSELGSAVLLTFSFHINPLKYERDDFLGVDVFVPCDVLDGLQMETPRTNNKVLNEFLNHEDESAFSKIISELNIVYRSVSDFS